MYRTEKGLLPLNQWIGSKRWLSGYDLKVDKARRLRNCNAWVIPCDFYMEDEETILHGSVLKSYETIVSVCYEGNVEHLGKWSRTTSRQQTWYEREVEGR